MKRRIKRGQWRELRIAAMLLALAGKARALPPVQQDPQWLSFNLTDSYLSMDAEGEQDTVTSATGGGTTTNRRIYLAPAIGVGGNGSIYHPDLFSFTLKAEPGYIWQETGPPGDMTGMNSVLQSYNFSGTFLQLKPYATTVFADASHDVYSYDFFNSAIMDQQTWGASTGYRTGPVPVTLSFQQTREEVSGLTENMTSDQTSLNLHAHNDRENGNASDLTYLFGQYDQTTGDGSQSFTSTGEYHYLTLTDSEHMDKNTLNSVLLFNHVTSDGMPSDNLSLTVDLAVPHTEHLESFYEYSLTYYDDAISEAYQNYLQAGIRHQLFDSLTSTLSVHATDLENSAGGSSLESQDVGVVGSLNYTKRLGSWGRLTLGNSASYDFANESSSGSALPISQESHSVPAFTPQFRLTQPNDAAVTSVTSDATHGYVALQQGVDYTVDTTVDPYQVTINFASLTIQTLESSNSVTVLVYYDVIPNPSGSYSTLEDDFNARLDLFHHMVGTYFRYQLIENYTDTPGFVLENVREVQAGADFNWRGLRLDANYLDRHSSLYDYEAKTLTESYALKLGSGAIAGVDLRQQWSTYLDQHQNAVYYDFLGHLTWEPPQWHFSFTAEGGLERQRGLGLDQDLYTARAHFNWQVGKFSVHLGYDYDTQNFNGELRERNFAYLRLRRNF